MNIVHITQTLGSGGAEKLIIDLAYNQKLMGKDVKIISLYPKMGNLYEEIAEEKGIEVIYLNKKKGFCFNTVKQLRRIIKQVNPNIIHTHLQTCIYVAPLLLKMRGVKCIHTVHNIANMEFGWIHRMFQFIFYKLNLVVPVAISDRIKESIIKAYKLDSSKVSVIYNGIDTELFRYERLIQKDEKIKFITVASFKEQKNHALLIDAFELAIKKVKQIELNLIGEGELVDKISATCC